MKNWSFLVEEDTNKRDHVTTEIKHLSRVCVWNLNPDERLQWEGISEREKWEKAGAQLA